MMALPDRLRRPDRCRTGRWTGNERAGFNLAELLFVLAAVSGLTVLVMVVIGSLITAEQHAAEALWIDLTVSGLAADLRQDAHQSVQVEVESDAANGVSESSVTFVLPEQTRVTYECTSDGVSRRQTLSNGIEAVETYRLALGMSRFLPPDEDGLLTWVHVRDIPSIGGFAQSMPDGKSPQRTFHVVAAVGLHNDPAGEDAP
jgi:Tfp pilus assembly protein FimT